MAPSYNYWTDDALQYLGYGPWSCAVSLTRERSGAGRGSRRLLTAPAGAAGG